MAPTFFETAAQFRPWLVSNHGTANEVIVGFREITPHCDAHTLTPHDMPLAAATSNVEEVLEVAPLSVRVGHEAAFEAAFAEAQKIISSMPGYLGHESSRCIERPNEFILLVRWSSLAAHEVGFRGSPEYQTWRAMLHHFYQPFPVVSHYRAVNGVA